MSGEILGFGVCAACKASLDQCQCAKVGDEAERAFEAWWQDGESAARHQSVEAQPHAFMGGWEARGAAERERAIRECAAQLSCDCVQFEALGKHHQECRSADAEGLLALLVPAPDSEGR